MNASVSRRCGPITFSLPRGEGGRDAPSYLCAGGNIVILFKVLKKSIRARAMQSPRTELTPPHETRQSPHTKPVSHLARISYSSHEHPDTPWKRFPTLFRTNPKVGSPYHRFVRYLEVVSRWDPNFSGLRSCCGIFREERPTWTH